MMDKMNRLVAVESNATRLEELKTARREKSRVESGSSDDFASELGAELMQAGAMAQAAARPRPEAVNVSLSGKAPVAEKSDEAGTLLEKAPQLEKAAVKLLSTANASEPTLKGNEKNLANRIQNNVEKSPLSMNTAASTNTAAAIAGLKPWSKDWVFDSQTLKDIQSSIPSISGQPEAGGVEQAQPSEQGARIEMDPRSRGEVEITQMQTGLERNPVAAIQQHHAGLIAAPRQMGSLPQARAVSQSSLSGNEFVATLSALRGAGESGAALSRLPFGQPGKQGGEEQAEQGLASDDGFAPEVGVKSRKAGGASFENGLESLNGAHRGIEPGMLHAPGREPAGNIQMNPAATEVTGHVVKGAMSQDRLSTESLQGIAGGIRGFSAQGGGEMKVRLRPDHLGELTIRVSTQGNQVGLKIQASSEESKKILEESLSHLKESMATQKLELGQVDLSVAKLAGGSLAGDSGMDHSNRNHSQQFQGAWADQGNAFGNLGNPSGQSRGNWGQGLYESSRAQELGDVGGSLSNPGLGRGSVSAGRASQANGRLDVRA